MSRLLTKSPERSKEVVDELYATVTRRIASNPPGVCPVDTALSFLRLCHSQSCGKCTPCRIGLGQLSNLLTDLLDGKGNEKTLEEIKIAAKSISDSADCAIGYQAAEMVLHGLDAFADDYLAHARDHKCIGSFSEPVPCVGECPAHVDIPGYIGLIEEGRLTDAVKLIRKDNPLPVSCAFICEHPCEEKCRRKMIDAPMNIRGLKRYAVDNAGNYKAPACAPKTGKKVAVIGGGPAGLTAAYYLELMGHDVTIFEAHKKLGGMLRYGIPAYRFPREELDKDIKFILSTGVEAKTEFVIGRDMTFDELRKKYDATFIAIGAQTGKGTGMDGEDANGVLSAVELLGGIGDGIKPDFKGKKVVVVGGGNVAADATRTSIRLGAKKVTCVYRRRKEDMTAQAEEVEGGLAEGAELITLQAPDHIEKDANGNAVALWTQPQIIGSIDASGRPRPEKANLPMNRIEADIIVLAIGQGIDSKQFEDAGVKTKRGALITKRDFSIEGMPGVFSAGDCVSGPATAVKAIAGGKIAAANIDEYLGFNHEITCDVKIPEPKNKNKAPHGRVNLTEREASVRKRDFKCIENEMTCQEADTESSRCLHCDYYGFGCFKGGRNPKW